MRTSWFSKANDEEIFHVLSLFLEEVKKQLRDETVDSEGAKETTKPLGPVRRVIERLKSDGWLARHGWPDEGLRERIYPLLWKGIERGFVFLAPPRLETLEARIAEKFSLPPDRTVRVVGVRGKGAGEHLSRVGAEIVFDLIQRVGGSKKRVVDEEGNRVHIAWGAGTTSRKVAKRLSELLAVQESYPPLTLHVLTSGFLVEAPETSPMSFFGFFDEDPKRVKSVGLFSKAVVPCKEYKEVKRAFLVKKSFELASQIDICISSLACKDDDHSLFNQFLAAYAAEDKDDHDAMCDYLHGKGWCGDVQYMPYSANGPIPMNKVGIRAVTLFELPELVQRANEGRQLVLVAGPCGQCGMTRTNALIPLLENPALRVWTHLVCDAETAEELVQYETQGS